MNIAAVLKEMVRTVITIRVVNLALTSLLKFLEPVIPERVLFRIPKVGIVTCALPHSKQLRLLSKGDDTIVSRLYFKGLDGFEAETVQLLFRLMTHSKVIFDIGANTGIYALIAAIESPEAKVFAFEPVPKIYTRLEKNAAINQVENLQTISSAVSNFDGAVTIYIPRGSIPTSSSTLRGFRQAQEEIQVTAVKVDTFVADEQIARIDLLKIDTEATEHLVLDGAKETLARDKPMIICEVLKGRTERELHAMLDRFDYRYFWITESGLVEKESIVGDATHRHDNYLFLHPDDVERISDLIQVG